MFMTNISTRAVGNYFFQLVSRQEKWIRQCRNSVVLVARQTSVAERSDLGWGRGVFQCYRDGRVIIDFKLCSYHT